MGKKLGRPPKPPEEQLSEIVPVRMTASERDQLQSAADKAKRNLSAWMRDRLIKAAKRETKS